MAKRDASTSAVEQFEEETFLPDTDGFQQDVEDMEDNPYAGMGEFNLSDEYKATPLVANGTYRGNVITVEFLKEKNCVQWKICLDGNGGTMNDGATEIDGSHHYYKTWLPKAGDENEMESNGKVTKRQGKINRMKKFADAMKIDMGTPRQIAEAIVNGDWVGLGVLCVMKISEYQGEYRNEIDRMSALPT